ncbi:DUF4296 domain-containing protein [Ichthyenterobacterium sp. W332]|uniref:DUF4296 domain-containing protein n=1 Tax=Microcosmobacter mediterraneus TaxID=3075607 RepID=A0ABU2YNC5_9FLAO|nr:DUF4296 domain-containing protein [Ichthyenterobacterium sp. W332]MDT0559670.1 DUF4296 domain-containing protein [Ichthyenterobacterium sp. W332]
MIKKFFIIVSFGIISLSCTETEKPVKPENLIPIDQMEAILYDSFILNATKASNKKTLERNGIFPQDYLFKKHNIDSTQFTESNAYYATDIELYQQIIDRVKLKLQQEKNGYTEALKQEDERRRKKQDSIKEARKKRIDSLRKVNNSRKNKEKTT